MKIQWVCYDWNTAPSYGVLYPDIALPHLKQNTSTDSVPLQNYFCCTTSKEPHEHINQIKQHNTAHIHILHSVLQKKGQYLKQTDIHGHTPTSQKYTHTHTHTHTHTDTVHGKHFPQWLIFQQQQEMSTSILDSH